MGSRILMHGITKLSPCVLAASWLTDVVVWGRQWEWWANEIGAF
jgi:hypothetical protein